MTAPLPLVTALREERLRQGLSQAQVAERVYVAPVTVGSYETGHSRPSVETLTRWADALGYELALYEPPPPTEPDPVELSLEMRTLLREAIHLIATACGAGKESADGPLP